MAEYRRFPAPATATRLVLAVRKRGGKWHRGGRNDYPGEVHCPIGLGLVLMSRGCQYDWVRVTDANLCRKCFAIPNREDA